MGIEELVGKTLDAVIVSKDQSEICLSDTSGEQWRMWHSQDCCESVFVEDICGDLADLIGTPILSAEEVQHSSYGGDPDCPPPAEYHDESYTWTFYKMAMLHFAYQGFPTSPLQDRLS